MKSVIGIVASSILITTGLVSCGRAGDQTPDGTTSSQKDAENPLVAPGNSASSGNLATSLPPASKLLGANLPAVSDYSRTHVYVDLVKQARPFGSADKPWDPNSGVAVGADGWPVGDFGIFLMTGQDGLSGIEGVYTVTFDGQAVVKPSASNAKIQNQTYDLVRNRTRLEVVLAPKAGQLALSFTQTGTGVKNLKVIRPGYNADNPPIFTNEFLNHVKRFGTLRFMDWLRTNQNTVTTWATRTDPQRVHHNSSKTGIPWEHVVALANVHEQDIWINIPVSATDDYVMSLARLLKYTLNPRSRIYVEYSNELWNGQFQQYGTNKALAEAEVKANPNSPLAHDGSQDSNIWMYRRIAKRGKEISDIFRSMFGDAAMMSRVRPVFATQVVLPYASEIGLKFIEAVYGPPSRYFYAMAGAPYFNLGKQQRVDGLSTEQVLQAMEQSVADLPRINQFEKNQALASWYGLPWLAYEGGADSFGPGSHDAKMAANLDPRMQDICERYLSSWYQAGGQLFMWYTAGAGNWTTQYGTWELTTDLAISDTPKIRCIDQTLAGTTPAVEGRNKAPGSFESYAVAGNFPPYTESSISSVRYVRAGGYYDYLVQAEKTGTYQLVLSVAMDSRGNKIDLSVNGVKAASAIELQGTGWGTYTEQAPIPLTLRAGFNTLRVTTNASNGGYDLQRLTLRQ